MLLPAFVTVATIWLTFLSNWECVFFSVAVAAALLGILCLPWTAGRCVCYHLPWGRFWAWIFNASMLLISFVQVMVVLGVTFKGKLENRKISIFVVDWVFLLVEFFTRFLLVALALNSLTSYISVLTGEEYLWRMNARIGLSTLNDLIGGLLTPSKRIESQTKPNHR